MLSNNYLLFCTIEMYLSWCSSRWNMCWLFREQGKYWEVCIIIFVLLETIKAACIRCRLEFFQNKFFIFIFLCLRLSLLMNLTLSWHITHCGASWGPLRDFTMHHFMTSWGHMGMAHDLPNPWIAKKNFKIQHIHVDNVDHKINFI